MKKHLKIPKFKNEVQERDFWAKVDLGDYYDADDFVHVEFPNLKPTTRSISIRMPEYIISHVKIEANKLDIPYQTLMKQYIAKGVMHDR
jgi:predicted DNA binding CopG/RHH family protein